jgi:hypothetical protein
MAKTARTDLPQVSLPVGNGTSVLTPNFPLLDLGKYSRVSDFSIIPPNIRIDAEIKKMVEKESERLRFKTLKYGGDESDWHLHCILDSADGVKDNAKSKLVRDGKSAVVSEVSKSISMSNIDHSSKYLLSIEPLYVYALSYAIYSEKVEDAEGVNDRIIAVVDHKIKPYFNRLIAKKIIRDRHLDLSDEQKKKILNAAASTHISYLKGEAVKTINRIIAKFVDYGQLNMLVDKFFESGLIDPERGTPQVRQAMVRYLVEIGLTVSPDDFSETTPSAESPSGRTASEISPESSSRVRTTK